MKKFVFDSRNLGGRKGLESILKNYFSKVHNLRPAATQPRRESASKLTKHNFDLTEVSMTFDRSPRVRRLRRGSVDSAVPETYPLSAKLTKRLAHRRSKGLQTHLVNLWHMNRRITDDLKHRKKQSASNLSAKAKKNPAHRRSMDSLSIQKTSEVLKGEMLAYICKYRLYKQEDLDKVYSDAREDTKSFPQQIVEKAISAVQFELDK